MAYVPTPTASADPLGNCNFGLREAFSLGVEEELLLVGDDNRLIDRGEQVVDEADPGEGAVDDELFEAMVEIKSAVSTGATEAGRSLREVRRELLDSGARLIGSGIHPSATVGETAVRHTPRYAPMEDLLQGVLRTPICGQHIHVGMPDEQTAVRAYNGIRTHVPLVNALAANSPFWGGEDSGLASARTVIFRSYPRAAMAPEFESVEHFRQVTRQVCIAGALEDYTHIWWDVRIHPALGTIEIRAADAQSDIRRAAALAALVHCLVVVEAERSQEGIPAREALAEASFQATRHGLDAVLLSRECERVPARELAKSVLDLAAGVAGRLGDATDELAYVETMLEQGCGADIQRRVYASRGVDGLLEHLVAETARLE